MVADVLYALEHLPAAVELVQKLVKVVTTQNPENIAEEIRRLELARLKSSDEIIAEADKEG